MINVCYFTVYLFIQQFNRAYFPIVAAYNINKMINIKHDLQLYIRELQQRISEMTRTASIIASANFHNKILIIILIIMMIK